MALSPADFYSYSRATGAPVPEDPEERARMAPEVLEYRRNQLKAPRQEQQQGPDPLSVGLGIGIALAGGAAGAYGLNKLLRGPRRSANAGVRQADLGSFFDKTTELKSERQEKDFSDWQARQSSEPQPSKQPIAVTEEPVRQVPDVAPEQEVTVPGSPQPMIRRHGRMVPREQGARRPSFTPRSYIEDTGAVAPVEDLTTKQQLQEPAVSKQSAEAVDTGLDQTIQNIDAIQQRDTDSVKEGGFVSSANTSTNKAFAELTVNPNESVVAQLNKRKALRQQALNQTRTSLGISAEDAPLPEGFSVQATQAEEFQIDPNAVGTLAEQKLEEAKQRRQTPPPAPITDSYRQALFDENGLLRPEIIANNLGDENVFPGELAKELRDAMSTRSTIQARREGGDLSQIVIANPGAHLRATKRVRDLLSQDNANTIKDYLISGGEMQAPRTKGFGYTGTGSLKTEVVTITDKAGQQVISVSGPKAAARYDRSDLEPLYYDSATGSYLRKSDIGATQSSEAQAGSGIGEEIGQAIGFVPRESVEKFTTSPGTSAAGKYLGQEQGQVNWSDDLNNLLNSAIDEELEQLNKKQGVDYAIGGVKEYGSGKESRSLEIQPRPLFNTHYEAMDADKIKLTNNGNPYLKIDKLTLIANPGLEQYIDPNYGTLFKNPYTNRQFTSPQEATDTYNRLTNNLNVKLIERAENRISGLEKGENLNIELSKSRTTGKNVTTRLNPNLVIDQVVTRDPSGATRTTNVTLAQALRGRLLNKNLIQEHRIINDDGSEGARFFKQTKYEVPENRMYVDKTTGEKQTSILGFDDANLPPVDVAKADQVPSAKNHYLFLQGVNNALEDITGQRVKVIDDAINLGKDPNYGFLGGPTKNPILREALTVANTLADTSEASRIRMQAPGTDTGLAGRYGLGARESRRAESTVPSRLRSLEMPVQQVQTVRVKKPETSPGTEEFKTIESLVPTKQTQSVATLPEITGAKRLVNALTDHKQRTGKALDKANVLQFASSIAQQENADVDELLIQASLLAKGAGQQATIGKQMSQGRKALGLMDVISPEEEVAQTVLEYDFGETVGDDLADYLEKYGPQAPGATMTEAQQRRAQVEPPGIDQEMLSNVMNQLRAQAGRRSGKRRNR
jgi:hypothetical protein